MISVSLHSKDILHALPSDNDYIHQFTSSAIFSANSLSFPLLFSCPLCHICQYPLPVYFFLSNCLSSSSGSYSVFPYTYSSGYLIITYSFYYPVYKDDLLILISIKPSPLGTITKYLPNSLIVPLGCLKDTLNSTLPKLNIIFFHFLPTIIPQTSLSEHHRPANCEN